MHMSSCRLLAMLLVGACAAQSDTDGGSHLQAQASTPDGKGFRAELEYIVGAQLQFRPGSLCHTLKRHTGGAGLYRVVSMESVMEHNQELNAMHPKTYVRLERLEAWSLSAPKDAVARINGGVYPDGGQGGFPVTLAVGEKVGLILDAPSPENLGFYSLHSAGVFADRGGDHYTNDRIFTKDGAPLSELARVISARADLSFEQCRKDDVVTDIESPQQPELPPVPPSIPIDQDMVRNESVTQ